MSQAQGLGAPDQHPLLGKVAVDDAGEVAVELEAQGGGTDAAQAGQPGGAYFLGVVGQSERAVSLDCRFACQELGDIDSARGDTAFGERHRSHDEGCDASRAGMAGGARPWGGAAGEQDGQVAATVHRATDAIPHRRIVLPFVDEDRFVDAEQGIRVGAQR